MRVGIIARLMDTPHLRGWNRYTQNLVEGLAQRGVELVLYSQNPVHPVYLARLPEGSFQLRTAPGMRLIRWQHRWLPGRCAEDGVDVLHGPFNFGMPWTAPCPRVLTLHDAIDVAYSDAQSPKPRRIDLNELRARLDHRMSRDGADRIITVSEYSRRDIVRHLGVPFEKIRVIHAAADQVFHQPGSPEQDERVLRGLGLRKPYIFYVGGWEGRKNIPHLVRAFAMAGLSDVDLVLGGGRPAQREPLIRLAEELGIGARLRLLEWIEDVEMPSLYRGATAFVYPSSYEGFGLQLCEAMALGCPVLAARATSLPEILGNGGELFDLGDPSELASLLRRVVHDRTFRDDLVKRGRLRSGDFSWERTVAATIDVYDELFSSRPGRGARNSGRSVLPASGIAERMGETGKVRPANG